MLGGQVWDMAARPVLSEKYHMNAGARTYQWILMSHLNPAFYLGRFVDCVALLVSTVTGWDPI